MGLIAAVPSSQSNPLSAVPGGWHVIEIGPAPPSPNPSWSASGHHGPPGPSSGSPEQSSSRPLHTSVPPGWTRPAASSQSPATTAPPSQAIPIAWVPYQSPSRSEYRSAGRSAAASSQSNALSTQPAGRSRPSAPPV